MPKRKDIESILIIGAGPIVIGQACEFDYSGAQACKALKEEGYRVILVNSNPATIMTDPDMADAIYIEPVSWKTVAKIIQEESPDALLPTMGGQTALNCALDLDREGILAKYNVELIGASKEAIDTAEDREKFKLAMEDIGLEVPRAAGPCPTDLFNTLQHTVQNAKRSQAIIASGIAQQILSQAAAQRGATAADPSIEYCLQHMHQNYSSNSFRFQELSKNLAIHRSKLSRQFHHHTGMTPSAYLRRLRLDHACKHLRNSTSSLQKIAKQCGFCPSN